MNKNLRAVIDLGSNTFHLLIAALTGDGTIREVYRERVYVKLAIEGIETIGAAPFARGIDALKHFKEILDEYKVSSVTALGTAALRTASNGPLFVETAKREADISIKLIAGDEEARLISRGVLAGIPPVTESVLIMDIGGGSTEFIIADPTGVRWRQSFPLGVSVLYNGFHHSDPITASEVAALEAFLEAETKDLAEALTRLPVRHLVGAAGTFDVLADLLRDETAAPHPTSHPLRLAGFTSLCERVIETTLAERLSFPGIPEQRADLIVVAMILLRFTFRLAAIERVTVSDWSMKEGILLDT